MTSLFAYTPDIWPPLITAVFCALLAVYVWSRRRTPGGAAFFAGLLLMALANIIQCLGVSVNGIELKIVLRALWLAALLAAVLALVAECLDYADILQRVPKIAIPVVSCATILILALMLTNSTHRLIWTSLWWDDGLRSSLGPIGYVALGYVYVLAMAGISATLLVAKRARGRLRYQAALVGLALIVILAGYTLDVARNNGLLGSQFPAAVLPAAVTIAGMSMLAIALFRLQAFDLTPIARHSLVEHMRDAMLVVDGKDRVVDANPAAARLFGLDLRKIVGKNLHDALAGEPQVLASFDAAGAQAEEQGQVPVSSSVDLASTGRVIEVEVSPVAGARSLLPGRLVVCRDVTEVRRAQATVERQRLALATVTERERLGRELHDGLAQVLAFAKMQIATTSDALERTSAAETRADLQKVRAALQEAHEEVRDFLLGLGSGKPPGLTAGGNAQSGPSPLCTAVTDFVARFSSSHGFAVEVSWRTDPGQFTLDPRTQVQLMRILQESLVNAHRHAGVSAADVVFERSGGSLRMVIKDEGVGFSPALVRAGSPGHYGLIFMRERAEAVGGALEVLSESGGGTEVRVTVPVG